MDMTHSGNSNEIRWYAGVPVGSNPLILLDFFTIMVISAVLCWGILLLAQFYFDGHVALPHLYGAAVIAFDLCLLFSAFYVIVSFIVMRNGYVARYRLDMTGAHCENIKCRPKATVPGFFHFCCYPVAEPQTYSRCVEKHVSWADVSSFAELRSLRVLILKGRRGTLMRIYCPDSQKYETVLTFLNDRIASERS